MPASSDDPLLQPSLATGPVAQAPYSLQASFMAGFFGGPFAALGMAGLNAYRSGRLARDLAWLLVLALAWLAFAVWWHTTAGGHRMEAWLSDQFGARGGRILERAAALLLCALAMLVHRREHKAADLMGLERPRGWAVVLGLAIGGSLLSWLLATQIGA